MTYRLQMVTPPVGNIITRDDVKLWLSESSTHNDDVIDDIIATVTNRLTGQKSILASTVLPTTWRLSLWEFPEQEEPIRLRRPPIISVDSFEYDNQDGMVESISNTYRRYDSGHEYIASWDNWPTDVKEKPSVEPIRIQYQAGYDTETPAEIKQAALAMCSHLFDNRAQYQTAGMSADRLDPVFRSILASYDLR